MKITKYEASELRLVLAGMVTDAHVLATVAPRWRDDVGLFDNRWANLIGGWAVAWYSQYNTAPGGNIEDVFDRWCAEGKRDDETVQLAEKFLRYLSDDYMERPVADRNTQYIIDRAGGYFEKCALKRLNEEIAEKLTTGDTGGIKKLITEFSPPNIGAGGFIEFGDQDAIRTAFEHEDECLVKYPGPLGEFLGSEFCRDGLISFMAPEKRGKTWWLIDLAWRAMCQRRRVAFFQVGDMSQNQTLRRMGVRAARRPMVAKTVHIPTALYAGGEVDREERVFDRALSWKDAWAGATRVIEQKIKSKESFLRLSTHPNSSISAMGIRGLLLDWARLGWCADVVVIDYADILAPPVGTADTRDQINGTWKALRRISQEFHCLVVTATQADAASYAQETLTRSNFSEDKRKLAHVTGMLGINQTEDEKEVGIMRLNWLARREAHYTESAVCWCAGCLDIGYPVIYSTMKSGK